MIGEFYLFLNINNHKKLYVGFMNPEIANLSVDKYNSKAFMSLIL